VVVGVVGGGGGGGCGGGCGGGGCGIIITFTFLFNKINF
jgi:hypothetical protein